MTCKPVLVIGFLLTNPVAAAEFGANCVLQTKKIVAKVDDVGDDNRDIPDVFFPEETFTVKKAMDFVAKVNAGSDIGEKAHKLQRETLPDVKEFAEVLETMEEEEDPKQALHNGNYVTAHDLSELGFPTGCGNNSMCFEDDMMAASPEQLLLLQQHKAYARTWPMPLPVCITNQLSQQTKDKVRRGLASITEKVPCVTFSYDCKSVDRVDVIKGQGCYSYIGKIGGNQELSIGRGCEFHGTIVHEFLHALGMFHEQSRMDRDKHISVNLENLMDQRFSNNFEKRSVAWHHGPYDIRSLMHYGADYFAKKGKKTITTPGHRHDHLLGNRVGMTEVDVNQLAHEYKCGTKPPPEPQETCSDDCTPLTSCFTTDHYNRCCACGGGYLHKCPAGEKCQVIDQARRVNYNGCVEDRTNRFRGHKCVVYNICHFPLHAKKKGEPGWVDLGMGAYLNAPVELCQGKLVLARTSRIGHKCITDTSRPTDTNDCNKRCEVRNLCKEFYEVECPSKPGEKWTIQPNQRWGSPPAELCEGSCTIIRA